MHASAEVKLDAPLAGGVFYLDDTANPGAGGWACLDGGRPERIQNMNGLLNSAYWVTNCDFTAFMNGGFSRLHNVHRSEYLRSTLAHVAKDVGLELSGEGLFPALGVLSKVASNVLWLAQKHYRVKNFTKPTLADELRGVVGVEQKTLDNTIQPDLLAAYQGDSQVPTRWQDGVMYFTLRKNRFAYFSGLMNAKIPENSWTYLNGRQLPPISSRLEWALNSERPLLLEVELTPMCDSDLAEIVAFGFKSGRKNTIRRWISHYELFWLHEYYSVAIKSAWISSAYRSLPKHFLPPKEFVEDEYMGLSYSAGLMMEAHFHSLSSPVSLGKDRPQEITPAAVFLRALDRAVMFAEAKRLHDAGISVTGYGMGAVRVRAYQEEIPKLVAHMIENEFEFPLIPALLESVETARHV